MITATLTNNGTISAERISTYEKVGDEIFIAFQKHNLSIDDSITILLNIVADICNGFDVNPDLAAEFLGRLLENNKKMTNEKIMNKH